MQFKTLRQGKVAMLSAKTLMAFSLVVGFSTAAEENAHKPLTLVKQDDQWETFENKKFHFEFSKPKCFEAGTTGLSQDPANENSLYVFSGPECKSFSHGSHGIDFSIPPFPPKLALDKIFSNLKASGQVQVVRWIDLGGLRAILSGTSGVPKDKTRWNLLLDCNSKRLQVQTDVDLVPDVARPENPPAMVMKVFESVRCKQ